MKNKFCQLMFLLLLSSVSATVFAAPFAATAPYTDLGQIPANTWGYAEITFDLLSDAKLFIDGMGHHMVQANDIPLDFGYLETYDPERQGADETISWETIGDSAEKIYNRVWVPSQNAARIKVMFIGALIFLENNDTYGRRIAHSTKWSGTPWGSHAPVPPEATGYGYGDWAEEVYYVYPDGTHVRYAKCYTGWAANAVAFGGERMPPDYNYEFFEAAFQVPEGQEPETTCSPTNTLMMVNLDGSSQVYPYEPLNPGWYLSDAGGGINAFAPNFDNAVGVVIDMLNTTNNPFVIGINNGASADLLNQPYECDTTWGPDFGNCDTFIAWSRPCTWGCYVPLWHLINWEQYEKVSQSPPAESYVSNVYLQGWADQSITGQEMADLANSWQNAPVMNITSGGFTGGAYELTERAYKVTKTTGTDFTCTLPGSASNPIVRPAFVIDNWGAGPLPILNINGSEYTGDTRMGFEGDNLVVWCDYTAKASTNIQIGGSAPPDTTPPTPDPMTWASAPSAAGDSAINMTATTATDSSGVEYYFDETTGGPGGTDSGWQDSTSYTDTGLNASTQYCYEVAARDKSANQNETAASSNQCATTDTPDTTPPTPDPMTWASVPAAIGAGSIDMTATTATDPSGVEYFFDETSANPGGSDSVWQDSATYTDSGLSPETQYCYEVTARDKSINQNATAASANQCATTGAVGAAMSSYYTRTSFNDSISGNYADVIVNLDTLGQLIFSREYSFRPIWDYGTGQELVDHLATINGDGPAGGNFDSINKYAYARIIDSSPSQATIHWRYFPDFSTLDPTGVVHEIYTIYSDGSVLRVHKPGTGKYDDWVDPLNQTEQTFNLTASGITNVVTTGPGSSGPPGPITGNPVLGPVVGSPVAYWDLDEAQGDSAAPSGTINGHKSLWKEGVSGTALGFDGYFSEVSISSAQAPTLGNSFTIDTWVCLGAYPYERAPIVHHSTNVGGSGYYLGVNEYGRPIFRVNGTQATASSSLPLNTWVHLVGAYGSGSMQIYVDASQVASTSASGTPTKPGSALLIGLNNTTQLPSDPVREVEGNYASIFGFEGLIDEVKIYNSKLNSGDITTSYNNFNPGGSIKSNPDIQLRTLPGQPGTAANFGANYGRLTYHDLWDNMWREDDYSDVIVNFDELPTNYIWWRGTTHGLNMVTENNLWMIDQSVEVYCGDVPGGNPGYQGLCEHMSDKERRFSHVRVLENTDARVVVHWRYTTADLFFELCTSSDFVDEYHTVYPDGTCIRQAKFWQDGSIMVSSDLQPATPPGLTALDVVNAQALSIANLSGSTQDLTWTPPNGVPSGEDEIQMVNFKSNWKVFSGGFYGGLAGPWGADEQSPHTADAFAGPWNHWPVSRIKSDGRYAFDGDGRVNSFALTAGGDTDSILYGFSNQGSTTTQNIADVIPVYRAWRDYPSLGSVSGGSSQGYNQKQREYNLTLSSDPLSFNLNGSGSNPIHNPCFVIKNWGGNESAEITINSVPQSPGPDFRQGIIYDTDGTETMVIWLDYDATATRTFEITKSAAVDTTPPSPDPATWASVPAATGETSIAMTATTATDPSGVEYYFDETTGGTGGTDSGWQGSASYTDTGLNAATQYCYEVTARDQSVNQNETAPSTNQCATTDTPDTTPPTPDPMTWSSVPSADSSSAISMTASTASDPSGVEYLFDETTGGGTDSGWQDSASYTDTGLAASTQYCYEVTARDKSVNQNATAASTNQCATTNAPPLFKLDFGVASGVGSSWTNVTLSESYTSPVVVAVANYDNTSDPAVVRIQNASGSSFDVRVDAAGGAAPSGLDVHYMVVEEGVYTVATDGVKMEAVKYNSTVTDENNSWVGQPQTYSNTYTSPVVLGQVMTYNDAGFSTFWCYDGSNRANPPSASTLSTGKSVAEDTDTTRNNETVGYIVIESGSGSMAGTNYVAALGADGVAGVTNSPPYTYSISGLSDASVAIASLSAMDGNNGGWALLYGANPVSATSINLVIDEDVVGDTERSHTGEQVAYIVFEDAAGPDTDPPTPNPATFASAPSADSDTAISMTATTGSDASGPVEYFFDETSGNPGGSDSGWQTGTSYTDTGLTASTQYTYTVQMRDSLNNTGTASSPANATTQAASDTTPPTPNPATWASVPSADSSSAISMTATTGSDPSGIQYEFDETSGNPGGSDSGWQSSASYTDTGLSESTQYTYRVRMRDQSANQNTGDWSTSESATTQAASACPGGIYTDYVGAGQATDVSVTQSSNDETATGTKTIDGSGLSSGNHDTTWDNGWISHDVAANPNPARGSGHWIRYDLGYIYSLGLLHVWNSNETGYTDRGLNSVTIDYSEDDTNWTELGTFTFQQAPGSSYPGFDGPDFGGVCARYVILTVNSNFGGTMYGLAEVQFNISAGAPDTDPPTPNPATFASVPSADSDTAISMTATTGSDATGPVEYFFDETSGNPGGSDSGWQTSTSYTDTGLTAETQYTYTVQMRDSLLNTGTASAPANATTDPTPDTDPPTPNPATFASAPSADSDTAISMTATTGTDATGPVEYFFDETSGNPGGTDSGWQTSASYTDTGLTGDTQYTYTVQMRDSAPTPNVGTASAPANVTTDPTPDTDPPTPNPATWASVPAAGGTDNISMTATTGTDATGPVEYYFDETSGNPGGSDSGWQTSASYTDTGLSPITQYTYTVQMRDSVTPTPNVGTASAPANATTQAPPDITPPTPDPMTWASVPSADSDTQISMTASTASDPSGVEYFFDETSGNSGGSDSGWQASASYTDSGLTGSTQYCYQVRARDLSVNQNATAWSTTDCATTQATPDTTPPTPDPMTWNSAPAAGGTDNISMTASTATDPSGVEYNFDETSGNPGGTDSGWQDSVNYTDSGLNDSTQYCYRVQARDKSVNQNATAYSSTQCATTDAIPDTDPPTPNPATFASAPSADSSSAISMTATTGSDPSGPVEYYFNETTGGPGATDSGWQTSPSYTDSGLDPDTQYTYTVQMRDSVPNTGTASSPANATTNPASGWTQIIYDDFEGGFGNWIDGGLDCKLYTGGTYAHQGSNALDLEDNTTSSLATTGNLALAGYAEVKVDFWYICISMDNSAEDFWLQISTNGGSSFDTVEEWNEGDEFVNGTFYPDSVTITGYTLNNTTQLRFRCDASGGADDVYIDEVLVSASGEPVPDTDPPTPNPATWASVPSADSSSAISMIATTGSDTSGVEYYFDETSGNPGGTDSTWQSSASYTDSGLDADTQYTYRVQMRDTSPNQNTGSWSTSQSATTDPAGGGPITVGNFSFENPSVSGELSCFGSVPDWSMSSCSGESGITDTGGTPTDGTQSTYLCDQDSYISQVTSHVISAGNYELLVDARNANDTGQLLLELVGGGTSLGSQTYSLSSSYVTKTLSVSVSGGSAAIGQNLEIRIQNLDAGGNWSWINTDNVHANKL